MTTQSRTFDDRNAQQLVDVFIPGLLQRAGIKATIAKTKRGRTIKIELPS